MTYEYYKELIEAPNKIRQESEAQFEKNILFITSGGIVLAITYLQAVHNDFQIIHTKDSCMVDIYCAIFSLLSLLLSLILNLCSHRKAIRNQEKNIKVLQIII